MDEGGGGDEPPQARGAGLRLRPLQPDGRDTIVVGPGGQQEYFVLGRHSKDAPNSFGVRDPRVSRRHVGIQLDPSTFGTQLRVTALAHNGLAVLRHHVPSRGPSAHPALLRSEAAAAAAVAAVPSAVAATERVVVKHGEQATVDPGDHLLLVLEDKCPPSGPSAEFAGNGCVYVVEVVPPHSLMAASDDPTSQEARVRAEEARAHAADARARAEELLKTMALDVDADDGAENRPPPPWLEPEDVQAPLQIQSMGSQQDPIIL